MSVFDRLKTDCASEWAAYVDHDFVRGMADGSLPLDAFRTYLKQDYLFLIHFSRAYALAIYKSQTLGDMRRGMAGLKTILEGEMELHVELCAKWGIARKELETVAEESETLAYTRFVLESGLRGDLLDLQVALAPCILGYGEIGARHRGVVPEGTDGAPAYARWFAEYASDDYQNAARDFCDWMDQTASAYLTEARYPVLRRIFSEASRLEADFWQMGFKNLG
ncbi:thiaminase II [Roseibium aestuarii]|uniref:Aminopyrimidine aminohydrolase n=1 Tax=Roseibium aestuarii TaxID=2600299 RepID=A0ABW4JQR8_9HYPH|nr:thiaminase II [Roseibium aestuarii]